MTAADLTIEKDKRYDALPDIQPDARVYSQASQEY